jgi:hypothetical protein
VKDLIRYDKMVETALRGVVREVLARAAASGLPGAHHFYITFRTSFPGLALPPHLVATYPNEMTVVLENQFWDLDVQEHQFSVTLNFKNKPERLTIPFEAITGFADPAVKFGLQFQAADDAAPPAPDAAAADAPDGDAPDADPAETAGRVVALDAFRKKSP